MIAQLDSKQIKARPSRALARLISHIMFQGRPLTTKGRWLNTFLFFQFALVKGVPQLRTVKKPIFILGTGRSGTTILGKILSVHPDICFLNEPKALWHAIHPREDLIGSYTRTDSHYRLFEEDATLETIRAAHRLYGYCLTLTFSDRVLDKYPALIFRLPFVQAIFPDAKFVFLVRDGWETVNSIARWSEREAVKVSGETHDWWGANRRKWYMMVDELVQGNSLFEGREKAIKKFERQLDMAAVEWIVTMQEGITQFQKQPNNIYLLHYEDLIENPKQTLTQLLAFCELPSDGKLLTYANEQLSRPSSYPPVELDASIADLFQQQVDTVAQLRNNKGHG